MLSNYLKEKERFFENIKISIINLISKPKYSTYDDVNNDNKIISNSEKKVKILLVYLINIISNSIIKIVEFIFSKLTNK